MFIIPQNVHILCAFYIYIYICQHVLIKTICHTRRFIVIQSGGGGGGGGGGREVEGGREEGRCTL